MDYAILNYLLYILISISLTIWVGRTLFKSGRIFLLDAMRGDATLTDSINHLLLVGFYLINFGYVTLRLKIDEKPTEMLNMIESLSTRIGVVLLILGAMHFMNLYIFSQMRKRGQKVEA